jgi:hypothetical protein
VVPSDGNASENPRFEGTLEPNRGDKMRELLMAHARRKAAVLTLAASAALGTMAVGVNPANAIGVSPANAAAIPQDGTGSSSWVTMDLFDRTSTQVEVKAWMNFPAPFMFPTGHWQILTPTEHYNTGDGPYQDFDGYFPRASGNYCAIWWYHDGAGNYINKGEPCVGN